MTKRELMIMLENIEENEEIRFVGEYRDRDGFPYDAVENKIYKVVGENAKEIRKEYGIRRIEG